MERFLVHVVDGRSNATLLLWDRETKRCLDLNFLNCEDEVVKKNKSEIPFEDLDNNKDGVFSPDLKL
ncbi:hypothetical protein AAHA92_16913 [Salvia divinorum]|uniref:Uncharacterized protein n=1 Tax=Salvia divinorum TaxID=28513 RepID=A0ABD1GX36_SALDI